METSTAEMQFYDIYDVWYTPWYKTYYFYSVVAIIFLFFSYLFYRWYTNRKKLVVELSASQKALLTIEKLKREYYNNPQVAYSILTHTLKVYLESYYKISLVGQTDSEFLETIALQNHATLLMDDLKIIFDGVAHIKFAGQDAQEEQFKKSLELAEKLINLCVFTPTS
jgi:hypothetical protein